MLHAVLCNLPELVDDLPSSASSSEAHVKGEGSSGPLSDSWHDTGGAASPVDLSVSQTWTTAGSTSSRSWTVAGGSSKADSIPSPGGSPNLAPLTNPPIKKETIDSILDFPPLDPSSRPTSPPPPLDDEKPAIDQFEMEVSRPIKKKQQPLSLVALLKQADSLFFAHPPQSLQVSQIMGPQSVIFTWCETNSTQPPKPPSPSPKSTPNPNPDLRTEFEKKLDEEGEKDINKHTFPSWTIHEDLISDDMAEQMVLHPELVVRAWRDEDEIQVEREAEMERESRRKAVEERALRKRRAKGHDFGLLGNLGGGGKANVVVVGGVVMVVALGVVIAVYGKNGEWRKWMPRNAWLSRNAP
jgi:hypothetical protein